MLWQDFVLIIGQIILAVALLPSVFGKDKPVLSTSLMSGTVVTIIAFTFVTLSLWLTAVGTALIAILWFILAYQKYSMDKKKE